MDNVLGGKAQNLLELQQAGFRVPAFVCSPPSVHEAVEHLGFPLVVRSSASAEDGSRASFAGQFETVLNLHTVHAVEEAIRKCRASLRAPGVREYCRRHGVDADSLRMNVVIQRMVQPELAGVAFTVNPATGAEETVIEACEGLAVSLLNGGASPLASDHPLVARHRREIDRVARQIQRHFGAPQDIEFAIQDGALHILQSRPITRIGFASGVGEWTNADFRDGGVSSTVCTPLMWSLYDLIWEDTLKGFLREIKLLDSPFPAGRMFFGRPYWNLGAVKQCLMKLPGFVEREFDLDLSVEITYDGDGRRTPVTLLGILGALPTILAIESIWKKQERFDREFLAREFETLSRPYATVGPDVDTAFGRLVRETYWITESNYFRTIYCTSLAKLDFKNSYPDTDYTSLVGGLPPLRHLEPTLALREMAARGETDLTPLLARFGHHSRRELDIRAPRWDEDREWVGQLLQRSSSRIASDSRDAYKSAREEALARLPRRKHRNFVRSLDRLRGFVWLREEMRDLSSRVYHMIRRHVLAIADRRNLGDDIFFMTVDQILNDDRSGIGPGRELYDSYRLFDAPHEIGDRFPVGPAPDPVAAGFGRALTGIAASHGTAVGLARVARSVEEAVSLQPGEILVCLFTDPGWTAVLDRAAGVVTETGGLLSHAAVICREYGIPAVLGVADATRRVRSGQTVLVDGTRGRVELVASGSESLAAPTHNQPQHEAHDQGNAGGHEERAGRGVQQRVVEDVV